MSAPHCLICDTPYYHGSTTGNGPDPSESCACGSMVSSRDAREMGEQTFIALANEWYRREKPTGESAEDAANERADFALDERGSER